MKFKINDIVMWKGNLLEQYVIKATKEEPRLPKNPKLPPTEVDPGKDYLIAQNIPEMVYAISVNEDELIGTND